MIAFKYTKYKGAEYLSHLDLLRHIERTLRRAGIEINKSEGFHRHSKIYLNNPLGTGVKSVAEYATVDAEFKENFGELFNAFSPEGVKCLKFAEVEKNQNYANCITRCEYRAAGIAPFDPREILGAESIVITDLREREVDIRPRIYAVERDGDGLRLVLGCGSDNLRPDLFCSYLESRFGGKTEEIIKTASFADEGVFL